jgi:hypothetical protein
VQFATALSPPPLPPPLLLLLLSLLPVLEIWVRRLQCRHRRRCSVHRLPKLLVPLRPLPAAASTSTKKATGKRLEGLVGAAWTTRKMRRF